LLSTGGLAARWLGITPGRFLRRVGIRRLLRVYRGESLAAVVLGGVLAAVLRGLGYKPRRLGILRWWHRRMIGLRGRPL
jgi:hypothetical protein